MNESKDHIEKRENGTLFFQLEKRRFISLWLDRGNIILNPQSLTNEGNL